MKERREELKKFIAVWMYGLPRDSEVALDYHLPSDLADALIDDGWIVDKKKWRYEMRVIPLDAPQGGQYTVLDTKDYSVIGTFAKVWDAVVYTHHLNKNGRPGEPKNHSHVGEISGGSTGVAG